MAYSHPNELVNEVLRYHRAGASSSTIGARVGLTAPAVRGLLRRLRERGELDGEYSANVEPSCEIQGITASEYHLIDEDEVFHRALAAERRWMDLEQRKQQQIIRFSHGPVGLVFVGDYHFGDPACMVRRAFADAELIASMPGVRVVVLGDVFNNMVVGRLIQSLIHQSVTIPEEAALGRRLLRILGPRLGLVMEGNHDFWTTLLTGHSFFQQAVGCIAPHVIYARHEAPVTVQVGDWLAPGRVRHAWAGHSMYNPTHGIDRAARDEHDFVWAAGAHTHGPAIVRDFSVGKLNGVGVQVGSYLYNNVHRQRKGFRRPDKTYIAAGLVFDEHNHSITGYRCLHTMKAYLDRMYRG